MSRFHEDDQVAQRLLDEAEKIIRKLNKRLARLNSARRYDVLANGDPRRVRKDQERLTA